MPGGKSVLDVFTKISKESEAERPDLCIKLFTHLSQYTRSQKSENCENVVSNEITYTLKRLIQGLGSSRSAVRKCYFATLSVLLSDLRCVYEDEISLEYVKSIVDKRLSKYESKGEEGEVLVGQILAYGAALRSEIFMKSSVELQTEIFTVILNNAKQKSYLPLITYTFVVDYIRKVDEELFSKALWPVLKNEILLKWSEQTFETLFTLLEINRLFPSLLKRKLVYHALQTSTILDTKTVDHIFRMLTNITWSPGLNHPLYNCVVENIVNDSNCGSLINQFWNNNVDTLISNNPTRLQQIALLTIFKPVVERIDFCKIPDLLTNDFVEFVIKLCSIKTDVTSEKSKCILQLIVTRSTDKDTQDASTVFAILCKLILNSGDILIDKHTGVKVVHPLTANLDENNVQQLAELLENAVCCAKGNKNYPAWNFIEKRYAIQLLARLVCHPKVQSLTWKMEQLKSLLKNAFFYPDDPEIHISNDLAAVMKNSFFSCLNHKFTNLNMLKVILIDLVQNLDALFRSGQRLLRTSISEDTLSCWKHMILIANEIETDAMDRSDRQKILIVFHVLFLHLIIYLLIDSNVAQDALKELEMCHNKEREIYKMRKKIHKKSRSRNFENSISVSEDDNIPKWIEVVVELFLSLLSRETSLFRQLISQVLPYLCSEITAQATHQILQVLDPRNNDNVLSNDKNSNLEESDTDSDMEVENQNEENDSDSEIEDEDDIIEESAIDKTRAAIHEALGIGGSVTDTESIDLDDFDEEEGKKLDTALSEAFKTLERNRNKSKKQTASDKALTNFRTRVLDMVDIYLDNTPSLSLVIDTLPVLFHLLEFCIKNQHQKQLEVRVRGTLKKIGALKKCSDLEAVNKELIGDILKSLMDKGARTSAIFLDISGQISECCIFLTRMTAQSEMETNEIDSSSETVLEVYKTGLKNFFTKRDCLLPISLFENLLSRIPWKENLKLCHVIIDFAFDSSVRGFRRNQAVVLLTSFYKNIPLLTALKKNQLKMLESNLSSKICSLLRNYKDGTNTIKESFVNEIFSLLCLVRSNKYCGGGFHWNSIGTVLPGLSGIFTSAATRKSYKKLCNTLDVNIKDKTDSDCNRMSVDASSEDQPYVSGDESVQKIKHEKLCNRLIVDNKLPKENLADVIYDKMCENILLRRNDVLRDNNDAFINSEGPNERKTNGIEKPVKLKKSNAGKLIHDHMSNGIKDHKRKLHSNDRHAEKIKAKKLRVELEDGLDVFHFSRVVCNKNNII